MPCKLWNNDWVAHLYEELEPAEERRLEAHLGDCSECRETMDSLAASRRLLERSAPYVPSSPGVVVVQSRSTWGSAWAFAAGGACAAVVFALGLFAAPFVMGTPDGTGIQEAAGPAMAAGSSPDPVSPTPDPRDEAIRALSRDLHAFEDRLALMEEGPARKEITPDWVRDEMNLMERRLKQERSRDYEYVMDALTASEIRTGTWLGQTQDALDMLALRQDPRFRER